MQLALFPAAKVAKTALEELFEPNGGARCGHCRKRLHAFAGRLLCVNPYCPGVTR